MHEIVKYDITDAAIAEMSNLYMDLTITDLDDEDGFQAVHDARLIVKGKRVDVEHKRKELKADALKWGKAVDSEAKRIKALLEPIETHLKGEEGRINDLKAEIKAREERELQKLIQVRVEALAKYDHTAAFLDVAAWTDDEYETVLGTARVFYESTQAKIAEEKAAKEALEAEEKAKEYARIAAEKKAREDEEKRLAQERVELDKIKAQQEGIAKAQAEKEAKIEADLKAIEDAKRKEAEKKAEQVKFEAAQKAEKERLVKEKAEAEANAKERAEREESLKPDRLKLQGFANEIEALTAERLMLTDRQAKGLFDETVAELRTVEARLRGEIRVL